MSAVEFREHAVLRAEDPGDTLMAVGLGPAGEAVALWDSRRVTRHGHGPGAPAEAETLTAVPELVLRHPLVQPLPEDRVLVVGTRTDGAAENAFVVDADGQVVVAARLGDGIEHVLATPNGDVWVGYFDEGVYGNDGSDEHGPVPVAHHGLVRWTADLRPAWIFPFDSGFDVIDDCYVLNVDGEAAWACYYSAFPIVRVDGDAVRGWRNKVGGAKALITDGETAALFGGYGRHRQDRVVVGELGKKRFKPSATGHYAFPDGTPLKDARLVARGPHLHAFVGPRWYRLDLDDLTSGPL